MEQQGSDHSKVYPLSFHLNRPLALSDMDSGWGWGNAGGQSEGAGSSTPAPGSIMDAAGYGLAHSVESGIPGLGVTGQLPAFLEGCRSSWDILYCVSLGHNQCKQG